MSQITNLQNGMSPLFPVVQLTPDNGNTVTADAMQNIDVFGGQGANGAVNIQTDGNPIGAIPLHELDIRLTDSLLLPITNASGSEGIIALGSTSYSADRFMHAYASTGIAGACTFLGNLSGNLTHTGSRLTGVGAGVFQNVTTGNQSVAMGVGALQLWQTGQGNTLIGDGAGLGLVTGSFNTGIGNSILGGATGNSNVAVGYLALNSNTGDSNIALGNAAMRDNTSAGDSIAIGFQSLLLNNGSNNVCIGGQTANLLLTGASNLILGNTAGTAYTSNESSNILLMNSGTIADANTIRIGTQGNGVGQQDTCFIAGIVGVTTSNSQLVTIDSTTGQLGVTDLQPFPWSVINADQTAAVNNGYICDKAGTLAFQLPATSALGDVIEVINFNTDTGTQITQGAGQQIVYGTSTTTAGAGGSLTSIKVGDTLKLVCTNANQEWFVVSSINNWTVV